MRSSLLLPHCGPLLYSVSLLLHESMPLPSNLHGIAPEPDPEQDLSDALSWQQVLFPAGRPMTSSSSYSTATLSDADESEIKASAAAQRSLDETMHIRTAGEGSVSCVCFGDERRYEGGEEIAIGTFKKWISLPRQVVLEARRLSLAIRDKGKAGMLLRSLEDAVRKRMQK
ncbi:hypothetical protein GUITHDRAFT_147293 [Guillardia theta CCMP2712]|uniref:Uncharacterized protein n=1 Tax=Guillardia theta (strain CCMP2712) TaxID=905079 RepID=L1IE05_GUITC|nr:hypothetical protein GUITHDRAFT_147293 [Guillardia theta CCMP2712]EKX34307.1 hypothetical protein GUITHDRAFT_147293 [Guillardia theta CCMP2712]|eukprot:XP_005821287.1 hypothetical protein GUITHDRAFT_147293 [Guillardia theta CCMP2712]